MATRLNVRIMVKGFKSLRSVEANASALVANFMYNQKITGTDAETPVWTYSPIKYWPNGNAIADDQDNIQSALPLDLWSSGKAD